jgi:hypothetical protein
MALATIGDEDPARNAVSKGINVAVFANVIFERSEPAETPTEPPEYCALRKAVGIPTPSAVAKSGAVGPTNPEEAMIAEASAGFGGMITEPRTAPAPARPVVTPCKRTFAGITAHVYTANPMAFAKIGKPGPPGKGAAEITAAVILAELRAIRKGS